VTPGTPPKPWFELKTFSQLQHRDVRNVFIGTLAKYLSQEKNVVENFFARHLAAKSTHENLLSFEGSRKAAVRFESGQVAQTPLNQKKRPTAYAASAFALPEGSVAFSYVKEQPLCQSVRALMSAKSP
jgi:hypothetical protein